MSRRVHCDWCDTDKAAAWFVVEVSHIAIEAKPHHLCSVACLGSWSGAIAEKIARWDAKETERWKQAGRA